MKVRSILLWVLIGIILAIALKPAVDWLVRHRFNRVLAALLVSFIALGVIVAVLFAIAAPVFRDIPIIDLSASPRVPIGIGMHRSE